MHLLSLFGLALATLVASYDAHGQTETPSSSPARQRQQIAASTKAAIKPCKLQTDYPAESVRNNEQETSRLQFTINSESGLVKAQITNSSGYLRLDDAAVKMLSQCTFKPARDEEDKAIDGQIDVSYIWKLK